MTALFERGTAVPLGDEVLADALHEWGPRVTEQGFAALRTPERYLLCHALARLPMAQITAEGGLPRTAAGHLTRLDGTGGRTFARVAAHLLADAVADGSVYRMDRTPLENGPAAIFVPNVGGQYPVRGGTVGNRSRNVLGIQPPIGSFYVASWLALLGVEIRAFNLELGSREFDACRDAIKELGERAYFLYSTSNFFTETEIESMYLLAELAGGGPRLVAAGYSSYFCRDQYLEYTPTDVVVGPHGEVSEADMIFASGYRGPNDDRPNVELFGHLPNLHLRAPGETFAVHDTPVVKLTEFERRAISGALDVGLMQLDTKYWTASNIMDVCAPDDLNIPLELVDLPPLDPERGSEPRERSTLGLSNYVHRPNSIKMMTVFGSCPRACQFCQLTQWGEQLYFYRGSEAVASMNRAAELYPGLQMYIFEDDDFLLRRSHVLELVESLRHNEPTRGRTFYVSTVPMEVDPEVILSLREVGFRAMLLGLESPVERVARQIGKFAARYDWQHILEAPRIGHDAGLHIRVTAIPFYPLLAESEIGQMISGLLDYLTYGTGISVAVHPLVKAAPGIELTKGDRHEVTTSRYRLPDGSGREVTLLRYVMPDDPTVREVALKAIADAPDLLAANQARLSPAGRDHPSQLGVLTLLTATLAAWRQAPGRTVDDGVLDALAARLADAVDEVGRKHRILCATQDVLHGVRDRRDLDALLDDAARPYTLLGLRMAVDFGSPAEVVRAASLAAELDRQGVPDWALHDSIRYARHRRMDEASRHALAEIADGLSEQSAPRIEQRAPKLLRLQPVH